MSRSCWLGAGPAALASMSNRSDSIHEGRDLVRQVVRPLDALAGSNFARGIRRWIDNQPDDLHDSPGGSHLA
jgi:hypothetical protein